MYNFNFTVYKQAERYLSILDHKNIASLNKKIGPPPSKTKHKS